MNRALLLLLAVALTLSAAGADAQAQQPAPAQAKPQPAKPTPKPDASATAKPPSSAQPAAKPTLLGQYDHWGAYWAAPKGHKICFIVTRSVQSAPANSARNPSYLFIASRPADKVKDEVSVIFREPFKAGVEATALIGSASFAMLTQADGAWIKNLADEARLVEAMRKGAELVLKGITQRGESTDTFSLRGLIQAHDRSTQACK